MAAPPEESGLTTVNSISTCACPSVDMGLVFGRDPVDGWHTLRAEVTVRFPEVESMLADELLRGTECIWPFVKLVGHGIESVVRVVV
jgi:hypothetical protein